MAISPHGAYAQWAGRHTFSPIASTRPICISRVTIRRVRLLAGRRCAAAGMGAAGWGGQVLGRYTAAAGQSPCCTSDADRNAPPGLQPSRCTDRPS